jgi:hypothetical protein
MNVLTLLVSTLLFGQAGTPGGFPDSPATDSARQTELRPRAAAPGKSPSAEEQRLFDQGMRAFQANDPREAAKAWRAGYDVGKDPAFLVRIGEAEEKAGVPSEAADSYRRYLRAAPNAADRAEIEQRLTRLEAAGAGHAPPPAAAEPAEVPGAFGDGGNPPTGGSPAAGEVPAAAPAPASDPEAARRSAGDDEGSGWNSLNITAWISTAATVLLLGTAGYYAASAGSKKDDVNQLLRYRDQSTGRPLEYADIAGKYQAAIRDGQHDDRVAKIALLAAGATAAVATLFFILDETRTPEPARHSAAPQVGLTLLPGGGAGAFSSLRWSF